MSLWHYLYEGGVSPCILVAFLGVVIVVLLVFFFKYCHPILKIYKVVKADYDLDAVRKLILKDIKRKHCKIVFVSMEENNPRAYKEINDLFAHEQQIVKMEGLEDEDDLHERFDQYKIIVFKVHPNEFMKRSSSGPTYKEVADYCQAKSEQVSHGTAYKEIAEYCLEKLESRKSCETTEDPMYEKIAQYCSRNKKHCILMTAPGCIVDIDEDKKCKFNPEFVTTVNFYSKLRETLYILLYFSAIKFK